MTVRRIADVTTLTYRPKRKEVAGSQHTWQVLLPREGNSFPAAEIFGKYERMPEAM